MRVVTAFPGAPWTPGPQTGAGSLTDGGPPGATAIPGSGPEAWLRGSDWRQRLIYLRSVLSTWEIQVSEGTPGLAYCLTYPAIDQVNSTRHRPDTISGRIHLFFIPKCPQCLRTLCSVLFYARVVMNIWTSLLALVARFFFPEPVFHYLAERVFTAGMSCLEFGR